MMKKSFTLMELLVVLFIISLIIALIMPNGSKLFDKVSNKIKNFKKIIFIKDEKFKCFLKEENNNTLGINKNGIKIKKSISSN